MFVKKLNKAKKTDEWTINEQLKLLHKIFELDKPLKAKYKELK